MARSESAHRVAATLGLVVLVMSWDPDRASGACAGATRVSIVGGRWALTGGVTYPGAPAEGLLMNVRMVNATFEDRNRTDFDPEANADEFIAQIPDYAAHGVRAFTLNLQGGHPGTYQGWLNADLAVHNSAFESDGSLRSSTMNRVARVIRACDQNGVAVILGLFYFGQDQALRDETAVRAGVVNAVNWIRDSGFTNVVLEIANEYPMPGIYDHPVLYTDSGQVSLIDLAHQTYPGLLVSTSTWFTAFSPSVAAACDYILVHQNDVPLSEFPGQIAYYRSFGKPVVVNEDTKLGAEGAWAAQTCADLGTSWGLMHHTLNQFYPFSFFGAADDPTVYAKFRELATPGGGGTIAVTGFTLVDADSDRDIGPLANGDTVDLAALPTRNLNVRADTSPAIVGSVRFVFEGNVHVENGAPYTLGGDNGTGDYFPWTPGLGAQTLSATPYSGSDAGGAAGNALTVTFNVVDGGGGGTYSLAAFPSQAAPGELFTVSWTTPAGQGSSTDWIGLYAVGADNTSYLDYRYADGSDSGSVTMPAPGADGTYEFRYLLDNGYRSVATSNSVLVLNGGGSGVYLSDLSPTYETNGWGPVERDTSNGEDGAGDGTTITLNGVSYGKGLGVHSYSEVRYWLGGSYTRFISDIGVDDEMDAWQCGSVVFQVWADGELLYDSGVMKYISPTQTVDVDVTGRQELVLVVTDAGDDFGCDHADWADARLTTAAVGGSVQTSGSGGGSSNSGSCGATGMEFVLLLGILGTIRARRR